MFANFKYVYHVFTVDNKIRNILNSEDGSSAGKLQRNQELYDLAKFFNCRTGGIPARDFDHGQRERLSQEIKQAAKEGREQFLTTANIITALSALLTAVAAIITIWVRTVK